MNLKKTIRLALSLSMIICVSCNNQVANDLSGSNLPDLNQYLITTNGNLSSLSQNRIDAEYSTFLFLDNESYRKVYLGGKYPE